MIQGDLGQLDLTPSQQEVDEIVTYLFSNLRSFNVGIRCRITLALMKRFFSIYHQPNKAIELSIHVRNDGYTQGVVMDARSKVVFNFLEEEDEDMHLDEDLKSTLNYLGPLVYTLKYRFDNDFISMEYLLNDLMTTVIQACTQLATMDINNAYLCCGQDTVNANTSIHTLRFGNDVKFGPNFFQTLSLKRPNLKNMTFSISSGKSIPVCMLFTSFKTFTVSWQRKMCISGIPTIEGYLLVFVTSKNEEGVTENQCCFKYSVGCDSYSTVSIIQGKQELEEIKYLREM